MNRPVESAFLVGRLEDDAAVAELPGDDDASARE